MAEQEPGSSTAATPGAAEISGGTELSTDDVSARERILSAAQDLFAERGFDATPTSQIAERASVPKGLVHYYFRRKPDLLVALVERLPREHIDHGHAVMRAALPESRRGADVHSAAELLALAVSDRHSTARHTDDGPPPVAMHRELDFLAEALLGASATG